MGWEAHGYVSDEENFKSSANGEFLFAKKNGKEYFIKRFPQYVFPKDSLVATGNQGILDRQARCQAYYDRCEEINKRVNKIAGEDGNLVICVDMFIEKNKIYKVYGKKKYLEISQKEFPKLYGAEIADKFMKGLLVSVGTLHNVGIVHSDIKYDNVFIVEEEGHTRCILTDFDDSFLAEDVPDSHDIVGSPEYYSPEMGEYIKSQNGKNSEEAKRLGIVSDIFALGILYYVYLTGEYPGCTQRECYSTLLNNDSLVLSKSIGKRRYNLISWMLEKNPEKRPSMCNIIRYAIQNEKYEIPNYWSENKEEKVEDKRILGKAKVLFKVIDKMGVAIKDAKIIVNSTGDKNTVEGITNEKGLWGTYLYKDDYHVTIVSNDGKYEIYKTYIKKIEYSVNDSVKKKIILTPISLKQHNITIYVKDKQSISIREGKYRLLDSDNNLVEQGIIKHGEAELHNIEDGIYKIQVQPNDKRYRGKQKVFDTSKWSKSIKLLFTLERKEIDVDGEEVSVEPPVGGICKYKDLKNGFYEVTYRDNTKKRIQEKVAKMILEL